MEGSRSALEHAGGQLTYAELLDSALRVAAGLRNQGARAGDRVALALPGPELVVGLHACTLIGAVALPIDLRLQATERAARLAGAALVLDEAIEGDARSVAPRNHAGDEIATVMFTSGTTAGPKEVALSYDNWLWNAIGSAFALGLDRDERWLCPMPLAHVGGLSIQIRSAIYGTTVLHHDRFETAAVLDALMDRERRVTLVSLVPTMLGRLLDAGLLRPPTLRRALVGGGPIPPALVTRARESGVNVAPSYGMTEACSQIATDGRPLLGVEVMLGPDGEVLVAGKTVATGALGSDGWLHSGDLGSFDDAGRLVISGRIAETIISGGENVAPAEVEGVLVEHPAVADAAVFGRPDLEWGEAVIAKVVLREAVEPEALRDHCAARLAPFKVPKKIELVGRLPRGATGKLLRRELR